jgi:hypothetical protein
VGDRGCDLPLRHQPADSGELGRLDEDRQRSLLCRDNQDLREGQPAKR